MGSRRICMDNIKGYKSRPLRPHAFLEIVGAGQANKLFG